MGEITVFADVSCPFAYVGLSRIAERLGVGGLRVRAWPLELVNGTPLTGAGLEPKVEALRRDVAPDRFTGFVPESFPVTSLPALDAEAAAYRSDPATALAASLALRRGLFEEGADIGDPTVVQALVAPLGVPTPTDADRRAVLADHAAGVELGVKGSPHFFTPGGDFFCPTLDIEHDDGGYTITFDHDGLERFIAAALG